MSLIKRDKNNSGGRTTANPSKVSRCEKFRYIDAEIILFGRFVTRGVVVTQFVQITNSITRLCLSRSRIIFGYLVACFSFASRYSLASILWEHQGSNRQQRVRKRKRKRLFQIRQSFVAAEIRATRRRERERERVRGEGFQLRLFNGLHCQSHHCYPVVIIITLWHIMFRICDKASKRGKIYSVLDVRSKTK